MATSDSIRLPFKERDLDRVVKENYVPGSELFIYDKGHEKSVPGLVLWVNSQGVQTFQLLKKIHGRKYRRNIGPRSVFSVTRAREDAGDLITSLAKGVDPKAETRKAQQVEELEGLTLKQAVEDFLEDADLAEKTRKNYRRCTRTTFKDVADKPLPWFTRERIQEIHRARSLKSKSSADHDARVFRLVWNWVREKYRDDNGEPILGAHPVSVLNKKTAGRRGWNNLPRRQSIVPKDRLPDWFQALHEIREEPSATRARKIGCFLLEALSLTGLRLNELARLPWAQVDRARGVITILDTSSKNRKPLVRPITRRIGEILDALASDSDWVFPGRNLAEDKPIYSTVKLQDEIQERTGIQATNHDLRRVFASAANRAGIPPLAVKRLLNHLSNAQEVTEGYQIYSLDELKDYAQAVEDRILQDAGLLKPPKDGLLQALQALSPEERTRILEQLQGAHHEHA